VEGFCSVQLVLLAAFALGSGKSAQWREHSVPPADVLHIDAVTALVTGVGDSAADGMLSRFQKVWFW